jgi:hypothetical protein
MKTTFSNIINPFMPKGNNPFMQVGIAKWYNGNKIDLDMES